MLGDDATLPETEGTRDIVVDERYDLGATIGRGGMGEVRLAKDTRIRRDVAIKLMRGAPADKDRFFREAYVQGALDHPAVVPVHDLGIDPDGQPYFVMKRLTGITLADAIPKAAEWPTRTLLARLVDICLAIEFAHARGVVHRDLKPANIMLGDYGEAYVLDWGLARILGDSSPLVVSSLNGEAGHTEAGALLGTPGYMSPEQARGEDVDPRTDVFALGCVLYEIVAGVPALPRGLAAIEATLAATELRPRERSADAPPELDELCARATASNRNARPTARQLADGIQAYLDGDRDVVRRRELALIHVERAQAALARGTEDGRAVAMREAGRAFVLDPTNKIAQDVIARLMLEAPKQIPAAAREAADLERAKMRRHLFRWGAASYAIVMAGLAGLFVFPVRHAWPIVASMIGSGAIAVLLAYMSRRLMPMRSPWYMWILAIHTAVLIGSSFIFGPLLIVPIFLCGSLTVILNMPVGYTPHVIVVAHVFAIALPIATELLGITPGTFAFAGDRAWFAPYAVELPPYGFAIVLVVAFVIQIVNSTMTTINQRQGQTRSLDAVHAQSWHLEQLLPGVKTGAPDERP